MSIWAEREDEVNGRYSRATPWVVLTLFGHSTQIKQFQSATVALSNCF